MQNMKNFTQYAQKREKLRTKRAKRKKMHTKRAKT